MFISVYLLIRFIPNAKEKWAIVLYLYVCLR